MNKFRKRLLAGLLGLALALCSCSGSQVSKRPDSSKVHTQQSATEQQTAGQTVTSQTDGTTAQQTEAPSGTVTAAQTSSQPDAVIPVGVPMWEGTSPGGNKMIFIGTLHAARDSFYPLQDRIKNAYDQAETVAVECNTEGAGGEQADLELQRKMRSTDGTLLKDRLSPEAYSVFSDQLSQLGDTQEKYMDYRPWAAYETLNALMVRSSDIKTGSGIDYYFMKNAAKDGKQLYELENIRIQTDMVTEQPDKLYDALFRLSKGQTRQDCLDEITQFYEAWLKGDLDSIAALTAVPSDDELKNAGMSEEDITLIKNRQKIQVDDRSVGMINGIKQLFAAGKKTLVAVGAAHFIGDSGIIALLEKEGYTFKRI